MADGIGSQTMRKTRGMLQKEEELGEPLEAILRRLYYDEGLTLHDVGLRVGVEGATVWRWLRYLGIPPKRLQPPTEETA
jgi:hypothetical protein